MYYFIFFLHFHDIPNGRLFVCLHIEPKAKDEYSARIGLVNNQSETPRCQGRGVTSPDTAFGLVDPVEMFEY